MRFVESADSTLLAYELTGRGPVLVVVTGALCDRNSPTELAAGLEGNFTVVVYDRRGRGDSGDGSSYAPAREVEDLEALLRHIGQPASVYGHSSGARLVLTAAAEGVAMHRLAVYEPLVRPAPTSIVQNMRRRVEVLLADGDRDGAAEQHLLKSGMPASQIAAAKASAWWPKARGLAHTLPYDYELVGDLSIPVDELRAITAPTLVLGGGESDPQWLAALELASRSIVNRTYVSLTGQGHVPETAVIVPILTAFFQGE